MSKPVITKENVEDIVNLSLMQAGMLFHYIKNPDSNMYFEQFGFRITGVIDIDKIKQAWGKVAADNEMLRTVFKWDNIDRPVQLVLKQFDPPVLTIDLTPYSANDQLAQLQVIKETDRAQKLVLESEPYRILLCVLSDNEIEMILSNHHILFDGWSMGILLKEFQDAYNRLLDGKEHQKPRKGKYKEFVKWLQVQDKGKSLTYWKRYLAAFEPTRLKTNQVHESDDYAVDHLTFNVPDTVYREAQDLAIASNLTLAPLLYAAWGVLLQRYTGVDDVVFGSVESVRPHQLREMEQVAGLFVNTLPTRVSLTAGASGKSLIHQISEDMKARENYRYTSLADIKAECGLKNNEWFDSIVVLENIPFEHIFHTEGSRLQIRSFAGSGKTNYDICLKMFLHEGLSLHFEYNQNLFDRPAMEKLAHHFSVLLHAIVRNPDGLVADLTMITDAERRQLAAFNDRKADYPRDKTIDRLFEEQAERTPERAAVSLGQEQLTYRELDEKANQMARALRRRGVGSGNIVAIKLERSLEMIVSFLGVLKAGAAFVPIDPKYPYERARLILEESQAAVLITQTRLMDPGLTGTPVLDVETEPLEEESKAPVDYVNTPNDLLYIIYTSGTTGKPKGVMLEHRNLVNLLYFQFTQTNIDCSGSVLQYTTLSFDVCYQEVFSTLLSGGKLHLIDNDTQTDVNRLLEVIAGNQIEVLYLPVSFLKFVFQDSDFAARFPTCVRHIVTAGEQLVVSDELKKMLRAQGIYLHNHYGPSETHVVTTYTVDPSNPIADLPPIGRPIANTSIYILDAHRQLVPQGVAGELYIAGDNVGRGYVDNPMLTAEKFFPDPNHPGGRMYSTGDLARWLPNGNIEYLGRKDDQVKIRGHRVELGEIESQLLRHPLVREASVKTWLEANGSPYLAAYIVLEEEMSFGQLRQDLAYSLPEYMLPSHFVWMEKLPITLNGKVNKNALPQPAEDLLNETAYIPPNNPAEEALCRIWQEVLGVAKLGIRDNFFELGGHSLKAMSLMSRVHKLMNVKIALRDIFEHPTIEQLAKVIQQQNSHQFISIVKAEQRDYYLLSSSQKRLFILHQLEGAERAYNMPEVLLLEGKLDRGQLEHAFAGLIARHDALRSSFELIDGVPVQRIHPTGDFRIGYLEASETEAKASIDGFVRPFDLSQAPLMRVDLIKIGEDKHLLLFDMHHIISDGMTIGLLLRELSELYAGNTLQPLHLQYKDYCVWQQDFMQTDEYKKEEAYWLDALAGEIPVLELPTDRARPALQSFNGDHIQVVLDQDLSEQLYQLAGRTGTTMFMVLLGAYAGLLHKLTGKEEFIVGSPITGRPQDELTNIMGMFINTLALRMFPAGNKRFSDFLKEVKHTALSAYEHQQYPFEELIEKLNIRRDISRNPIFDTMFELLNVELALELTDVQARPYKFGYCASKFDLTFSVLEEKGGIKLIVDYCTALFNKETIERWARCYVQLLRQLVHEPDAVLGDIELLSEAEREHILVGFNDTAAAYDTESRTFHEIFEEQAARTPDQTALVVGEAEWTYAALNAQANRLARALRAKGVRRETIVGIMARRSADTIIGALAVMKAGGAYLPIDPAYPAGRIAYLLRDSQAALLLTQRELQGQIAELLTGSRAEESSEGAGFSGEVLYFEDDGLEAESSAPVELLSGPEDLAYVIYTSGTTGQPKGVMIEHRSFVNVAMAYRTVYRLDQFPVRLLQMASFSFDVFSGDMARTFANGGQCVLCPEEVRADIPGLARLLQERGITIFESTPALITPLFDYVQEQGIPLPELKVVIVSSDSCSVEEYAKLQTRFGADIRILNVYGVTEASIDTSYYEEPLDKLPGAGYVPIGKPMPNMRMYVVNDRMQLQPVGVPGELVIGGAGVARGYYRKPELSAEKFVANPFVPGERLYRTGDLVRWMPDGNLEYLGRIDNQVQLRGYRVELGEVESRLLQIASVREAAAIIRDDGQGERYLCAYVVADEDLATAGMREDLAKTLPHFMIPSYFVRLERMPLTPNGKVDRKALPAPDREEGDVSYIAPRNELEDKLAAIWQDVLRLGRVGVRDNFFEIGGHSLRATAMISRIHKELNVQLPLREVFLSPTIEKLAFAIEGLNGNSFATIVKADSRAYYPLSSAQKRLYILQQMPGSELIYNMPHAMMLEGRLERGRLEKALSALIERHEALRTSFEMVDGVVVQRIHPAVDFQVRYRQSTEEQLDALVKAFAQPFDLEQAPLFRVELIALSEERHLLLLDMNHMISDGFSLDIIHHELGELYAGKDLLQLDIQYKDYAVWERKYFDSDIFKVHENYWLSAMAGELSTLQVPTDYRRSSVQSFAGDTVAFSIDKELTDKLRQLSMQTGTTLYMALMSAYHILLHKYTGQEDIRVGSLIAGRSHADLEPIVGMFVNTLVIRAALSGEKTAAGFLQEMKQTTLAAYEHQDYPFDRLVEKLGLKRDLSRNPLFDTLFALHNTENREKKLSDVAMKYFPLPFAVSLFDLSLDVVELGDTLYCTLDFMTSLFKKETVQRMSNDWIFILRTMTANVEVQIKDIHLQTFNPLTNTVDEPIEFIF
ncbi:non-ribosomal peptide synthetase [Paenibacillus oleatilyticus]|uniref:non-ribosomal peptide synthetase n=1 Tax=Paenibacillus oleatilyticus TaxID=2594886 RepID=UPI001C1F9096|nr:non-ribosomal peptide synthetase [Paenibacillus oleatilyticus]MBU7314572.1 amino acid adenylation domain-containing protein [Paenibacillus oleatilyticus]